MSLARLWRDQGKRREAVRPSSRRDFNLIARNKKPAERRLAPWRGSKLASIAEEVTREVTVTMV
jgi:hypothetical protein